jgi:hypothetical protein
LRVTEARPNGEIDRELSPADIAATLLIN